MTITVYGTPAPQGSKRFVGHAKSGRGIMIESSAAVKPWREAVRSEAQNVMTRGGTSVPMLPLAGPVRVRMVFTLARPAAAKKREYPHTKPDLSKLVRATEDALTDAGVWEDDARVVELTAAKEYPRVPYWPGADVLACPGCVITIESA